ncbi:MAG TPA: substrate-binding domain-containing protein [Ignavibacteria bacterium]|nr:substrate-binding domain-containing protein [Ignavibacteria bacterium]
MINKFLLILAAIPFLIFSGCDWGQNKSKAITGEITIEVDENFASLMETFKTEFERLNPEAKINYVIKPAKVARTDLLNHDTKVIMIGGGFTKDEEDFISQHKIEFIKYDIAIDGIGFIVNPSSPVERLTSEDLKKIFTGEYTKWSQIKALDEDQNQAVKKKMTGKDDEIKLYIQRPNSSAYEFVKDSVLFGADFSKAARICSTSVQMMESIRSNKSAIGIINLSSISTGKQDAQDTTVRPIRVSYFTKEGVQHDFIIFHQGTVAYKTYPYFRKFTIYTTELGISTVTGFATFLLNKDGQKIVLEKGLVPVSQPVRIIKLD